MPGLAQLARVSKTRSIMIGASPSDGSSSRSRLRLGEQRARDRELLLLAAGELAAGRGSRSREDREALEHALEVAAASLRSLRAVVPSRRFSATVSVAKICRPSGTSATPRRTIRSGASPTRLVAASTIEPPTGGTSPRIAVSVVDLPAPFGPIIATISPSLTSNEIECSAATRP